MTSLRSVTLWFSVVASSFLLVEEAKTQSGCPPTPLGVTVSQTEQGEKFTASAFVRPFQEDEDSLAEARSEARIKAKLLLKRDSRVPRRNDGLLLGVVDLGSCLDSGRVYFTVSVDSKSVAEAIELNETLKKSLGENPAPVPSFSWLEGEKQDPLSDQAREIFGR
jgi:hypothetical protein